VVHGIPAPSQVLAEGDLISVDCGAILEGWHGDAAITVAAGEMRAEDAALSEATRLSMFAGAEAVKPGARLTDLSHAIETATHAAARRAGVKYGIIKDYGGHGIGSEMHMEPFLPNYGKPGKGPKLVTGMAIAIEPMLTLGTNKTIELEDGWTVITQDGCRAAHWEHTVAVTDDGPWILTAPED
jgi:methionyl aminopeptidase